MSYRMTLQFTCDGPSYGRECPQKATGEGYAEIAKVLNDRAMSLPAGWTRVFRGHACPECSGRKRENV